MQSDDSTLMLMKDLILNYFSMSTKRIIADFDLDCTPKEFDDYVVTEEIDTSIIDNAVPEIRTFDIPYNGNIIENPANGEVYYFYPIGGRIFLQNIVPYIEWNNPITNENVQSIITFHKDWLRKDYIEWEKFKIKINHFLSLK